MKLIKNNGFHWKEQLPLKVMHRERGRGKGEGGLFYPSPHLKTNP